MSAYRPGDTGPADADAMETTADNQGVRYKNYGDEGDDGGYYYDTFNSDVSSTYDSECDVDKSTLRKHFRASKRRYSRAMDNCQAYEYQTSKANKLAEKLTKENEAQAKKFAEEKDAQDKFIASILAIMSLDTKDERQKATEDAAQEHGIALVPNEMVRDAADNDIAMGEGDAVPAEHGMAKAIVQMGGLGLKDKDDAREQGGAKWKPTRKNDLPKLRKLKKKERKARESRAAEEECE